MTGGATNEPSAGDVFDEIDEGGDAACWAHLVCEECGRVAEPGIPHRCEGDEDGQAPTQT